METQLTKKEYLAEHATQYAKLSAKAKNARYQSYLRAWRSQNGGRKNQRGNRNGKNRKKNPKGFTNAQRKLLGSETPVVNLPKLSGCAKLFLKAQTDPFGLMELGTGEMPCIPDLITLPSQKYLAKTRGNFTIGVSGCGFVAVSPFCPTKDSYATIYTDGTYNYDGYAVATYTPPVGPTVVGVLPAYSDAMYVDADFASNALSYRPVGVGVKAFYSGSEMFRNGMITLHRAPNNINIPVGSLVPQLLNTRTTIQAPITRKDEVVCYRPNTQAQLGYVNFVGTPGTSGGAYSLLILCSGATVGQTFSFEVIHYFEAIGNATPSATASHSDVVGMGVVQGALSDNVSKDPPGQQYVEALHKAQTGLAHSSSGMVAANEGQAPMIEASNPFKTGLDLLGKVAPFAEAFLG